MSIPGNSPKLVMTDMFLAVWGVFIASPEGLNSELIRP
jgi:hypothetical protein